MNAPAPPTITGTPVLILSPWGKLLGLLSPDRRILQLPLEVETDVQEGEGGRLNVVRAAHPVAFLESVRTLPVPEGAIAIPLESLDADDRASLEKAFAVGMSLAQKLRAGKTGLVVASAMPTTPTHQGRA